MLSLKDWVKFGREFVTVFWGNKGDDDVDDADSFEYDCFFKDPFDKRFSFLKIEDFCFCCSSSLSTLSLSSVVEISLSFSSSSLLISFSISGSFSEVTYLLFTEFFFHFLKNLQKNF